MCGILLRKACRAVYARAADPSTIQKNSVENTTRIRNGMSLFRGHPVLLWLTPYAFVPSRVCCVLVFVVFVLLLFAEDHNNDLYPVIAKTVYTEYAPNGQYKRLTGTWVVEGDTSDDFIGTVRIYVDDHLQYEVSSLTVNSPASALSLSISGASTVRIEVEGAFASLRAVGYLYLADAKFEN